MPDFLPSRVSFITYPTLVSSKYREEHMLKLTAKLSTHSHLAFLFHGPQPHQNCRYLKRNNRALMVGLSQLGNQTSKIRVLVLSLYSNYPVLVTYWGSCCDASLWGWQTALGICLLGDFLCQRESPPPKSPFQCGLRPVTDQ